MTSNIRLNWNTVCPNGESIHIARLYGCESRHWELHSHDFFECFLVIEGTGKQLLLDSEIRLKPGDLFFIRPDHTHGFKGDIHNPLSFYNVAIKSSVVNSFNDRHNSPISSWSRNETDPVQMILSETNKKEFLTLVSQLEMGLKDDVDAEYFLSSLVRILRTPKAIPIHDEAPYWMREVLHIASQPENIQIGIKKLIELCGRSQEHVTRSFKKYMGMTPTTWINKLRIMHSQYLLVSTRLSILDITLSCGFESPSHFHSLFRKETGESPAIYRRRSTSIQVGFR